MAAGSTRACDRIGPMEEGEGGGGRDRTFLGQLLFHPGSLARRVVRPGIVLGIGQSRFSVSRDPWRCAEFDISREGNRPESSFPRDKPGPLFTGRHFPPLVLRDSKRKKLQNYSNRSCRSFLPIFHPILIRVALAARMKACFAYVYHDGR